MEQIKTTWFGQAGFIRNPFALEPLGLEEVETPAFVDRAEAREQIREFVQESSGSLIVISEIGYGKSSMMNLTERYAKNAGKTVYRIDPRNNTEKICFFKSLINEIFLKLRDKLSPGEVKVMDDFLREGNDHELHQLLRVLKEISSKYPSVLVMDDLDKMLDFKNHIKFVKEVLDLLPKNMQVITTGDINQIMNSRIVVSILYQIFDFPILLEEINSVEKIKEFVYGRMNATALKKDHLKLDDEIFGVLLDRTRGNLRETFRYLSALLKTKDYSKENLIKVIVRIDAMRLHVLDTTDKQILLSLAGRSLDINGIKSKLLSKKSSLSKPMIRVRLDELHQNGMVYKYKVKNSKKVMYQAPITVELMLKD